MASMNTRLNIEKLDGNIVQKHGGSKQVGFKQLGPGVETGVHGVHDEKRVWFEVELQGAQGDHEAEVFQVSNDDTAVAQRRLEDKQPEEKTNTDCLVKFWSVQDFWAEDTTSIKQRMLEPVKVKCILLGYHKSIMGNKLWRLDDVTSKVVLYKNMGFNESGEYKKTFIGSGVGTGSMQVLQGDEFEVEPQDGHTFVHVIGSNTQYREDSNEAAFAVAAVEKIYAHESLTFNNTVTCEVISKWKAGLKDDMDARSDMYVLSNGCKKCSDDSDGYYWESTPEGSLSGDCDVEKNGKWSCIYAVGSQEYQMVCTRLDIASADVGMLDKFDRGLQTDVQRHIMTLTGAWKKKIWLKGLMAESGYELSLVAGIATGALVKGGSRSEVPAQVEGAAYRCYQKDEIASSEGLMISSLLTWNSAPSVDSIGMRNLAKEMNSLGCVIDKGPGTEVETEKEWSTNVYMAVNHFFIHGEIPPGCNSSFIALIPKVPDANLVKDFRPISLIGSIYKIIAKILSNRLVNVLGDIVNEVQSAFIAKEQMLDGPVYLNEILQWCTKKKKTLIFKVDFEKAFDSIRWDFLDDVLKEFGFRCKWRNWIQSCLTSSKGSILVNGCPTNEFQFYKGLKQGILYPPSPLLSWEWSDGGGSWTVFKHGRVTTYAVRITWLIADIEDKYHGPSKYGDSDGYTFDDPILILEILSRRFILRGIYLITGSSKDGDGDTSFQWSQFTTQCSHLMFPRYPKETIGYSFYYLPKNKIFVARNAEFLENSLINHEASRSLEDLEIIQEEDTHPSLDTSLNHKEDDQEIDEPQRDLGEPANYKAALLDPESDKWLNAINVEIQSMKDNKVWELVDLPPNGKTIGHKFRKWMSKLLSSLDISMKRYTWSNLKVLSARNFKTDQNCDEPCVYVKASGSYVTFLILYVDDILIMGNNILMLQDVKSYLGRCFAMKDLGEAAYILGIKLYRVRSKGLIGLFQSAYIEKILKRFYVENSKRGTIPMQEKLKLSKSQGASASVEIQRMQNIHTPWLLDQLCELHWTTVKNILKYLRNTKDMFLDANEMKSQTGYVFVLNGVVVDWKSTKQSIFATSSTDVEYIAAFDASKKAVWIRKFISGLGVFPELKNPLGIKIYRDRSKRLIGLCQSAYIEKILKRYYMENSKRGTIPMQEKLKFSKSQGASTPAEIQRMQNIPYASVKRELRVSCYTDAGYLTDADDMKSQTRYVFILNGGAVDWKSTKQSNFATSSTYAKYIAAFDASKEAVWIHKFNFRPGVVPTIEESINMYCDNTGAIAIAKDL
ncbi:zinc finger, CCHC-type containing protein [Tanacetum coccineum]